MIKNGRDKKWLGGMLSLWKRIEIVGNRKKCCSKACGEERSRRQCCERGKLYPKIKEIAFDRLKGAACKTLMLEVIVEDTAATKHLAYVQEVMVKPQSYGGDTAGVNIPFDITDDGARTKGYVTAESLKSGKPVFAEGEIVAA